MNKRVIKFAKPVQPREQYDDLTHHAGNVLDNPMDGGLVMSLADRLSEVHPNDPHVQLFQEWVNGTKSWRDMTPQFRGAEIEPRGHTEGIGAHDIPNEPYVLMYPRGLSKRESDNMGIVGKAHNQPYWQIRRPRTTGPTRPHPNPDKAGVTYRPTIAVPGTRMTGADVAAHLLHNGGLRALLLGVVGARFFHPANNAKPDFRSEDVKFRRKDTQPSRKYAKVDGHVQAHHLVAGFPIEHALRHLANDANNTTSVRDLAKLALTGKDHEGKDVDISQALYALHDAMDDAGHPLRSPGSGGHGYNWMSAADKIHIDHHTYTALTEEGERMRKDHNEPHQARTRWPYRPEGQATRISRAQNREDPVTNRSYEALTRVIARTKALSKPKIEDEGLIHESIRRHAVRSHMLWRQEHGVTPHVNAEESISPPSKGDSSHAYANHPVTRYARLRLGESRPFTSTSGESMTEHDYHDEAGKKLGVVRVQPRNEGRHLHIDWVGPTNVSSGEVSHTVGTEGMRSLKGELKKKYPTAEFISGIRTGGFRTTPERVVKPMQRVKRYEEPKRDFIDALRRIRSSNQEALHKTADLVAKRLGLHPIKVFNALNDTPRGSTPGIAQAIYGNASPEKIHAAGAWLGLTGNIPGVSVFHSRDSGPDTLYKFKQEGSGLDIRQKLDRHGLADRILIPAYKGFDILVPDQGSQLAERMTQYSKTHGVQLQVSRGYLKTLGSQDQARAREIFRNTVSKQEHGSQKMARVGKPIKYSSHEAFSKTVNANPEDSTARNAYADWIEEEVPDSVEPHTIEVLRRQHGPVVVGLVKGKVRALPVGHGTTLYHATSRNSRGRAHGVRISGKVKTWKTRPGEFRVPWKFGLYDNGELTHNSIGDWLPHDPTEAPDRKRRIRFSQYVPESVMKKNVETLKDKRRKIGKEATQRYKTKLNQMPVEKVAARVVAAIKQHGPLHKRGIYAKTSIRGKALDDAAKHAKLVTETKPAHANGSGPPTTWYSLPKA